MLTRVSVWHIHKNRSFFVESDSIAENNGSQGSYLIFIYILLKSTSSETIIKYMM